MEVAYAKVRQDWLWGGAGCTKLAPLALAAAALVKDGDSLKAVLRRCGWTSQDWQWKCRRRDVKFLDMVKLARSLGVPMEDFVRVLEREYIESGHLRDESGEATVMAQLLPQIAAERPHKPRIGRKKANGGA